MADCSKSAAIPADRLLMARRERPCLQAYLQSFAREFRNSAGRTATMFELIIVDGGSRRSFRTAAAELVALKPDVILAMPPHPFRPQKSD